MARSDKNNEQRIKAFALFTQGKTYAAMGKELGISRQRAQQLVRPPRDIYNAVRAAAHDACQDCGVETDTGHVHHVKANGRTPDDFNEPDNRYLCISCHHFAHTVYVKSVPSRLRQQKSIATTGTVGFRVTAQEYTELLEMTKRAGAPNLAAFLKAKCMRGLHLTT